MSVWCFVFGVWGALPFGFVNSEARGNVPQTLKTKHQTRPRAMRPKHHTPYTKHPLMRTERLEQPVGYGLPVVFDNEALLIPVIADISQLDINGPAAGRFL